VSEAAEHTANAVYGAPVAKVMSGPQPGDAAASDLKPMALPSPMPFLPPQNAVTFMVNEAAIARDSWAALARCKTPPEFLALYGRFVMEFFNRAATRAIGASTRLQPKDR
jgi:hypothetical protein